MESFLSPEDEQELFRFISGSSGIRLPDTLFPVVLQHVASRLAATGDALSGYLARVRSDTKEFDALMEKATIGETYFFRDEKQFDFLDSVLIPSFLKSGRSSFLAWSAACSTGEEALSLALLLERRLGDVPRANYRIFATDINRLSLERLSSGSFRRTSVRSDGAAYHHLLEPYLHDSFLQAVRISGPVLDSVQPLYLNFSSLDYSAVPDNLDVIFIRNVLIYIEPELRERIFGLLSGKLRTGGCLFLSASEIPLFAHPDLELKESGGVYHYEKNPGRAMAPAHERTSALRQQASGGNAARAARPLATRPCVPRPSPVSPAAAVAVPPAVQAPAAAEKGRTRAAHDAVRASYELINSNDTRKARELLSGLRDEAPDSGALRFFLSGYCDLRDGDTRSAVELFSRCLEQRPGFWIARYHRAILLSTTDRDSARRDFMKTRSDIGECLDGEIPFPEFFLEGFNLRYFSDMCGKWAEMTAMTGVRHADR